MKINVVGDLSLQDPARLKRVMFEARDCDILIQVGDMHPAYDVLRGSHQKLIFAVPGNHDVDWDTKLAWPRQWRHDFEEFLLIGLDNSQDTFSRADWQQLDPMPKDKPVFVVVHKPLSRIVLPDGSESSHCMGEGSMNSDAITMMAALSQHNNVLLIHGHYHGFSFVHAPYGDYVIEGRGGAAPQLGYTTILVTKDGWTLHSVNI